MELNPSEYRAIRTALEAPVKRLSATYDTALAAYQRDEGSEESVRTSYDAKERARACLVKWLTANPVD